MTIGLSVESVADSGLESLSEVVEKEKRPIIMGTTIRQSQVESTINTSHDVTTALLQLELARKDRILQEKTEELARLTVELKEWQEKASRAAEKASHVAAVSAAVQEFNSREDVLDGSCQKSTRLQKKRKSRLEPYVSQIPVSVRRCQLRIGAADLRCSPIPNGSLTSDTHQESVHTAGSSLSQKTNYSLSSHIPRPIGDKGQVSLAKAQDGPEGNDEAPSGHPALDDVKLTSPAAATEGVEGVAAQAAVAEVFVAKEPFAEGIAQQ
jgi:hypothetical protein